MFQGSTDFLSYVLMVFLSWIYLPYTIFRFSAEIFIDLGRKKDSSQLEEIIGAFLPGGLLCAMAWLLFYSLAWFSPETFKVDWEVIASMFGQNRGAVSDYIYAGSWKGCAWFLGLLWGLAAVNGLLFGRSAQLVMKTSSQTLCGLDTVMHNFWPTLDRFDREMKGSYEFLRRVLMYVTLWLPILRVAWVWHVFFEESLVPLYPWREQTPTVRVTTRDRRVYSGTFVEYEKAKDGRMDIVRLIDATRVDDTTNTLAIVQLRWRDIVEMSILA